MTPAENVFGIIAILLAIITFRKLSSIEPTIPIRVFISFVIGFLVFITLVISSSALFKHSKISANLSPPINPTLTQFLNFEPVKRGIIRRPPMTVGDSGEIETEARLRKMERGELTTILNNEMYVIRLPPGYTVKVIPPTVKPEVTEIPPTSNQ